MGAIGWELPYLCSCDSDSNHAARFLQSWKTALIARGARVVVVVGRKEIRLRRTFKYWPQRGSRALAAYVSAHNRTAASVVSIDNNNSHFVIIANISSTFQFTDRAANGIICHNCLHGCCRLYPSLQIFAASYPPCATNLPLVTCLYHFVAIAVV